MSCATKKPPESRLSNRERQPRHGDVAPFRTRVVELFYACFGSLGEKRVFRCLMARHDIPAAWSARLRLGTGREDWDWDWDWD